MKGIGTTTTIDTQTGKELAVRPKSSWLLPPPADACQVCAVRPAHHPDEPHNKDSIYYKYHFLSEHDRWPTWRDAIAHCPPHIQRAWEKELRSAGVWPE